MFLKTFKWEVVLAITAAIPFVVLVTVIMTRLDPVLKGNEKRQEFGDPKSRFWYAYGALVAQSK